MHVNERGVVRSKGDEMGVESSDSIQIESICPMLRVALTITSSSHNSSKGVSSRHDSTKISYFEEASE